MTKIISTDKARQGHSGRHVLVILVVGLLLAFIAWGLAELYGELIDPPQNDISAVSGAIGHPLRG